MVETRETLKRLTKEAVSLNSKCMWTRIMTAMDTVGEINMVPVTRLWIRPLLSRSFFSLPLRSGTKKKKRKKRAHLK